MAKQNHYDVLGVPPDADDTTIKKAWKKRISATHPDREGGDAEEAAAVNTAYEVLSNPARRKAFDEGKDDQPVVDQLTAFIMTHFIAVVAGDVAGGKNWIAKTRERIQAEGRKADLNEIELKRQVRGFERSIKYLVFKGKGNPLLINVIENRIETLKKGLETVKEDRELVASAIRFLEDYDWAGPVEDPETRHWLMGGQEVPNPFSRMPNF